MVRSGQAASEYAALALERVEVVLGRQAVRLQDFATDHTMLVAVLVGLVVFLILRPRRR
ncbi:MAG: hypothetical protein PVI57_03990 [Gemmatimonadota bacterium]|jgi:hypothetical protein